MNEIKITNIKIFPIANADKPLRALVRITLNNVLELTSLRIYKGSLGLFLSYPNDPNHPGEDYRQLFYPVDRDFRDYIEKAVLEEYQKAIN